MNGHLKLEHSLQEHNHFYFSLIVFLWLLLVLSIPNIF